MLPSPVLRTILLPVLLLSVFSLSAAEFQFDDSGVTASVTPSATSYWACTCVGTFNGSMLLAYDYAIIPDTDGDGIVRWELGSSMKPFGLWSMIDGTAGTITTQARGGVTPARLDFPPKAFLRDGSGVYSRFVISPAQFDGSIVWWVRPGVGAWKQVIFNQGPFDELTASLKVMIDPSKLEPVEGSPAAPTGFEPGDFVILIDDQAQFWSGDRVDAHLNETLGAGAIEFASAAGDEDSGRIEVKLVRLEGTDGAASIHYATSDLSAVAGVHYQPQSGSVSFDPGQIFRTIEVPLVDDHVESGTPKFRVTLSDASGATIGVSTHDFDILDNDDTPYVTIEDRSVTEGDGGPTEVPIRFTLNHSAPKPVTLAWRAYDRLRQQTLETGTLELAVGEKEKTIAVHYVADDLYGFNRSIGIEITSSTNATRTREGRLTIVEDEPAPVLTLEGTVVSESAGSAEVTLRLSAPLAVEVGWEFHLAEGSAKATFDFTALFGVVPVPAGATSATITIAIRDDEIAEPTETFDVVLPAGFGPTSPGPITATVTIVDDDGTRRRAVRH